MSFDRDSKPAPELDPDADPADVARTIVLRALTASAKSRKQLAQKLSERHIPPEVAEAVLDRFEEVQLVDDAAFAEQWVRNRFNTRSLARGALRRELGEKGITGEVAEAALEQLAVEDETEAARELVSRKLTPSNLALLEVEGGRDKLVRRLVGQLARKGYSPGMALNIVNQQLDGTEPDDSEVELATVIPIRRS